MGKVQKTPMLERPSIRIFKSKNSTTMTQQVSIANQPHHLSIANQPHQVSIANQPPQQVSIPNQHVSIPNQQPQQVSIANQPHQVSTANQPQHLSIPNQPPQHVSIADQYGIDFEHINLTTPANKNTPLNFMHQDDPSYFDSKNRRGITGSALSGLLGFFTNSGKEHIGISGKVGFKEDSRNCVSLFNQILTLLRGYEATKNFLIEDLEMDDVSKMFCEDGKKNEPNAKKFLEENFTLKNGKLKLFETSNTVSNKQYLLEQMFGLETEAKLNQILETLPDVISVSPDGVLCDLETKKVVSLLEIKCRAERIPDSNSGFQDVDSRPYDEIPAYYYPQIQWEMFLTGVPKLILQSWSKNRGSNFFECELDMQYCLSMLRVFSKFFEKYIKPLIAGVKLMTDRKEIEFFIVKEVSKIVFVQQPNQIKMEWNSENKTKFQIHFENIEPKLNEIIKNSIENEKEYNDFLEQTKQKAKKHQTIK